MEGLKYPDTHAKAREAFQRTFCKFDYEWQKMPKEEEKEVHE